MTVSGNLGGKEPVVNNVLSSNEQEIYPTNSFEEDYLEFEFQRDRNYYVNLRQTNLALKLNFVKARSYETYKTKEVKRNIIKKQKNLQKQGKHRKRNKRLQVVSLSCKQHFAFSFSNVEVHINNQQFHNSN